MLLNPFPQKLSYIKPVEKQQKTTGGILFHVFNKMVTKKTQVVFSNLFVLAREISDLIPGITSALRSFPIFFNLDFPQLFDRYPRKDVEISYQCTKRFNKTPDWAINLI